MSNAEPRSRVGSRFGPYQLLRLIGRGGMGEVYEAEDTRKHRVVALKLISKEFSGNPVRRARIQREADAAGRLTEPHVVPIHDYGEIDGKFYLEMRLIDGTALSTMLSRNGPLDPARTVAIVRQVAAALDAAHAIGVAHRDVKPENILVTDNDFAYLVDFGIARAITDPGLTQIGTAVGTYNYMAPERLTGDDVTCSADIYALACVMNECLTGSPPFRGDTIERLIAAHLMEAAPRPSELRPGTIPPAMDEVIAKGMAKRPEDRYRTAGELAAAGHDALGTLEQHKAVSILQQSENGALLAGDEAWTTTGEWAPPPPTEVAPTSHALPSAPAWVAPPPPPLNRSVSPDGAPSSPPSRKRKLGILAIAAVVLFVAAIGLVGYSRARSSQNSGPSTPASTQTVVSFPGLNFHLYPGGVALGGNGDLYVANQGVHGKVVKLPAGSDTPIELPFNGLYQPQGLAVDGDGSVYVADFNNRVMKLAPGSNNPTALPFTGLNYPEGVAVDAAGNVYVADRGNNRVVKWDVGSNTQTVLPFTGLNHPDGVAVDAAGSLYVTDTDNNRVLKLAAGSGTPAVLPFTELNVPWGVAVDGKGNVYVTEHDSDTVVKLEVSSKTQTDLPFTGLNTPLAVAVDSTGNVYVADRGNNRVVKLSTG